MEKKKIILPIFIIAVMVFSTFGIIFSSYSNNSESFKYKNYRFTYDGQSWSTFKNNQRIEFLTDPRELDTLTIGDIINKLINHNKIYITIDYNQNLAVEQQFFKAILNQLFQKPIIYACTKEHEKCQDLPIKECQDPTPNQTLIINLQSGNNTINERESCIIIEGDRDYFIKVLEKIKLEMLL